MDGTLDAQILFYIDLLDTIHCFWLHSYQLGLRTKTSDGDESAISMQLSRSLSISRSQKFSPDVQENIAPDYNTGLFRDNFDGILRLNDMYGLIQMLNEQEYDTDSILVIGN